MDTNQSTNVAQQQDVKRTSSKLIVGIVIGVVIFLLVGFHVLNKYSEKKQINTSQTTLLISPTTNSNNNATTSSISQVFGIPCQSNPRPTFTHDLTEVDNIFKITPTSLIASKSQDRAFLWIDTGKTDKVPLFAPVDADLVKGVFKISKTVATIDYDLHFQVSCEVWFFINHISNPIDKIKKFFPDTPATSTASDNFTQIFPLLHFKAGELIGYTIGTAQAHNFDFAVFDLNHRNTLIGQGGSTDSRFKNFICPFDLFPENLKNDYYKKLDPSLISESNCK